MDGSSDHARIPTAPKLSAAFKRRRVPLRQQRFQRLPVGLAEEVVVAGDDRLREAAAAGGTVRVVWSSVC
jgi:hypothetical protein